MFHIDITVPNYMLVLKKQRNRLSVGSKLQINCPKNISVSKILEYLSSSLAYMTDWFLNVVKNTTRDPWMTVQVDNPVLC